MKSAFSLTYKSLFIVYLIVSLLLTSLLLIGVYYCQTNVEDLELAIYSRELGIAKAWMRLSVTYDGRYFTNLMQGLNPLVYNSVMGYKWMVFAGFVLFNFAIFSVVKACFSGVKLFYVLIGTLSFSAFYFQQCGSLAYALYWMGSSFVYLYPSIFLLINIVLFIAYVRSSKPKLILFIPLAFSLFFGIGCSELYLPFYLFLSLFLPLFIKKNYPDLLVRVIPLCLLMVLGIWFMIASPGLGFRFDESQLENHLNTAILVSSVENYGIELLTLINFPFFLLIFLSASLWKLSNWSFGHVFKSFNLGWILFLFLVLPYLMSLPYFVTKSSQYDYPVRVYIPIVFVQYVLVFFFIIPTVLIKYFEYIKFKSIYNLSCSFFLFFFSIQICIGKGQLGLLFEELLNKKMEIFDTQLTNRYVKLESSKSINSEYVLVNCDTLKDYPRSMFTHPDKELNRNTTKWNKFIEGYFGIDEIKAIEDTTNRFMFFKCYNK